MDVQLLQPASTIACMALEELYAVDPLARLAAAKAWVGNRSEWEPRDLPTEIRSRVDSQLSLSREVYGAANAWLMLVGPSPGGSPPGAGVERPKEWQYPVDLGRPHSHFQFRDSAGFWRKIREWAHEAFSRGIGIAQESDALSLTMLLNLLNEGTSDARVLRGRLHEGAERFWSAVRIARPRLVLVLTKDVWNAVTDTVPADCRQKRVYTDLVGQYSPTYSWIQVGSDQHMLLAKAPNHPSRPYPRVETYDFLGKMVRTALQDP